MALHWEWKRRAAGPGWLRSSDFRARKPPHLLPWLIALVPAIVIVLIVLWPFSSHQAKPTGLYGTVRGVLEAKSASGLLNGPQPGTVTLSSGNEQQYTARVRDNGTFNLRVPTGTYLVVGRSSRIKSPTGANPCFATEIVVRNESVSRTTLVCHRSLMDPPGASAPNLPPLHFFRSGATPPEGPWHPTPF